ncbi:MAG TPA: cytochrome c [Ramlibacter sp.]|jgi:ubiquinol-cytochrome c reductase cytochrome c subunit|nr:cytochrome c [Ramlibacter sp.]
MKWTVRVAACLLGLACVAGSAAAQGNASDVERGHQLFMKNGCYSCHGTVGQGGDRGAGPRIAPMSMPVDAFKTFIRNPPEAMPRFDERFVSDADLEAIHRYISSLPKGRSAKEITLLQAPR